MFLSKYIERLVKENCSLFNLLNCIDSELEETTESYLFPLYKSSH